MQRLNALFSFIENQFAAGSRYFDVKQLSRAMQKAKDGYFSPATDSRRSYYPRKAAPIS